MIMSERDSVHKEIEKLQEEVSFIINVGLSSAKCLIFFVINFIIIYSGLGS